MIEIWWAIWSAWAWWRYLSLKEDMPILSRQDSRDLLNSLVASGITNMNELEAHGVRHIDIKEWKQETNNTTQEKLNKDIDNRYNNINII